MALERIADEVWSAPFPHVLAGLHIGTRMTVVRLSDGSLFVHSPIRIDEQLKREIDALGPVAHIVAPSLFHHVYFGEFAGAYPNAKTHAAAGLGEKRKDLVFHETLGPHSQTLFGDELRALSLDGMALGETVFFHEPSRTLVTADFLQNFDSSEHWPTRLYMRAAGVHQRTGLSRVIRLLIKNKAEMRRSVDEVLECEPQQVTLAHGKPILSAGDEAIRQAYGWLR